MITDGMMSSKTNEWSTPNDLFSDLDLLFGFTLDPCCTHENAKCKKYFTKEDNGLIQDWSKDIVFMNPPYGREIGKWMKKAYESYLAGATVVCLIPSRTDTRYWHDYAMKGKITFIKGRLYFGDGTGPAPFPSVIITFEHK